MTFTLTLAAKQLRNITKKCLFSPNIKADKVYGTLNINTYSEEIRCFALTLHYYSPKSYKYVRKSFGDSLPHTRTISKWMANAKVTSGFNEGSFESVKERCRNSDKPILVNLVHDEMHIKQHLEWDHHSKKWLGFADIQTSKNQSKGKKPLANEALNYMIVAVNDSWKMNMGHFFIRGLDGDQRADILTSCLTKLHETGVTVTSVTCDGLSSNLTMATHMGANFKYDLDDMTNPTDLEDNSWPDTTIPHPVTGEPIFFLCDAVHMLKLLRNTLGSSKILFDKDGNEIKWQYIVELHKIQQQEGLHLANKLSDIHINYKKKPMNVKIAAQTLSKSVADALEFFLKRVSEYPQFEGCEATIRFIRLVNNLTDILNSRNLNHFGFKKPMCKDNYQSILAELTTAFNYIKAMKIRKGDQIISVLAHKKHTGFLGFLTAIQSVLGVYKLYVVEKSIIWFLATYKLSQDHLELEHGVYRSLLGSNNNPTVKQYNRLVQKRQINNDIMEVTTGNCLPLENVKILTVSSSAPKPAARSNLSIEELMVDETDIPELQELSEVSSGVVAYIGGFCARSAGKRCHCKDCNMALKVNGPDDVGAIYPCDLIETKSFGYLIYPSESVHNICSYTEQVFRACVCGTDNPYRTLNSDVDYNLLVSHIVSHFLYDDVSVFNDLDSHIEEHHDVTRHKEYLIQLICECFLKVRFHFAAKKFTEIQMSAVNCQSRARSLKTTLAVGYSSIWP